MMNVEIPQAKKREQRMTGALERSLFVTGASSGLGLAIAGTALARGWRVFAGARDPNHARGLQGLKEGFPGRLQVVRLDVRDDEQLASLAVAFGDGKLDVLINNAGVSARTNDVGSAEGGTQLGALERKSLVNLFDVNAVSPLLVVQACLPQLRKSARPMILNVSTIRASFREYDGGANYGYRASKCALNAITQGLDSQLRAEGFSVLAVHPGWVQTSMGGKGAPDAPGEVALRLMSLIDRDPPVRSGSFVTSAGDVVAW